MTDSADTPIVRDKRRIDPTTGALRPEAAASAAESAPAAPAESVAGEAQQLDEAAAAKVAELESSLAERTADLQRLKAEFDNYRRRVERDRVAVAEQALASVLLGLLPVLDDLDRARAHGELEGGLRSIADNLETTVTKLGLERFGTPGEPFDPNVHEALSHTVSPDVEETVAAQVYQPGYRLGSRVLRPARVAVAEPAPAEAPDERP